MNTFQQAIECISTEEERDEARKRHILLLPLIAMEMSNKSTLAFGRHNEHTVWD